MKLALIASGLLIEAAVIGYIVALHWFPAPWPSTAAVVLSGITIAIGMADVARTP